MTALRTIKGIDSQIWSLFKSLAARNNMRMGDLFGVMVNEFEEHSENSWDEILSAKASLKDKDADKMERTLKQLRREKGFRV